MDRVSATVGPADAVNVNNTDNSSLSGRSIPEQET
jgi:hypothetical protein